MMSCRDVSDLVSQHLDGELPVGKRIAVRMHLLMCKHCRRFVRQLRVTIVLLGTLHEVAPAEPDAEAERQAAMLAALPVGDAGDGGPAPDST